MTAREFAARGNAAAARRAAGRAATYAELRDWGYSQSQAAARMEVSVRTVQRYEKQLKQNANPREEHQ